MTPPKAKPALVGAGSESLPAGADNTEDTTTRRHRRAYRALRFLNRLAWRYHLTRLHRLTTAIAARWWSR